MRTQSWYSKATVNVRHLWILADEGTKSRRLLLTRTQRIKSTDQTPHTGTIKPAKRLLCNSLRFLWIVSAICHTAQTSFHVTACRFLTCSRTLPQSCNFHTLQPIWVGVSPRTPIPQCTKTSENLTLLWMSSQRITGGDIFHSQESHQRHTWNHLWLAVGKTYTALDLCAAYYV